MSGVYSSAVTICRAEFETALAQVGIVADWRRRERGHGSTGGAISLAAKRPDPGAAGWLREIDNPQLYSPAGQVRVVQDVPAQMQSEQAGKLLTGTATGYASLDSGIGPEDILLMDGVAWIVDATREQLPYLELTLRRQP